MQQNSYFRNAEVLDFECWILSSELGVMGIYSDNKVSSVCVCVVTE